MHLPPDVETAEVVGRRKTDRPVILRIRAAESFATAVPFYATAGRVWLSAAEYIEEKA